MPPSDGYEGVVGVNNAPFFDSFSHTQGGAKHLLQHLLDEYVKVLNAQIEERKAAGKPTCTIDEAVAKMPMMKFLQFGKDYLTENRPVQNFFVDENVGLRLSNNANIVVSPGINVQGTMQNSGAISVTHGVSQREQEGVLPSTNFTI